VRRDWITAPDVEIWNRRCTQAWVIRIVLHADCVRVALQSAICRVSDSLICIASRQVPVQHKIIGGACLRKWDSAAGRWIATAYPGVKNVNLPRKRRN